MFSQNIVMVHWKEIQHSQPEVSPYRVCCKSKIAIVVFNGCKSQTDVLMKQKHSQKYLSSSFLILSSYRIQLSDRF